jgi:Condensation domain/TubC N-terminal docking domain
MSVFGLILPLYEDGVVLAVENGQITFRDSTGALSVERRRQLRERRDEVIAFLQQAPFQTRVPSYNMERILAQAHDGVTFGNGMVLLEFTGKLDIDVLRRALDAVVHRHASLRTQLQSEDCDTHQTVLTSVSLDVEVVDVSTQMTPVEHAHAMVRHMVRTPFDRSRAPLLRASIFIVCRQRHIAGIVVDHLVCDATSQAVLLLELREHYLQMKSLKASRLRTPRQYHDFSMAQRIAVKGSWQPRIARCVAALVPYYSAGRCSSQKTHALYTTCSDQFRIGVGKSAALAELSTRYRVTPYTIIFAAYALTLATFFDREAVPVWTVMANRDDPLTVGVIGFCVNPLPIWVTVDPATRCIDFLRQVSAAYLEALGDRHVPAHCIGKALKEHTGQRLEEIEEFGINFNYSRRAVAAATWADSLRVVPLALRLDEPKTWYSRIYLWMTLSDDDAHGTIAYCRQTLPDGRHLDFLECMDRVLESIIKHPIGTIKDSVSRRRLTAGSV